MKPETKKIILITLWCLAATVLAAGAVGLWIRASQFSLYQDSQYQFSMKYPKDWEKREHAYGTAVVFVRPKQTALDIFQPNVNVTVQDIPDTVATLGSFSETITKQMKTVFKNNINIIEDKNFTFGQRRGHRLIFAAPQPDNLKTMVVWTIKAGRAVIFTFIAKADQYQALLSTVDQMVESFQLR